MSDHELLAFFQDGIDDGWVWQLQGAYGRTATALIQAGLCHPAQQVEVDRRYTLDFPSHLTPLVATQNKD